MYELGSYVWAKFNGTKQFTAKVIGIDNCTSSSSKDVEAKYKVEFEDENVGFIFDFYEL